MDRASQRTNVQQYSLLTWRILETAAASEKANRQLTDAPVLAGTARQIETPEHAEFQQGRLCWYV